MNDNLKRIGAILARSLMTKISLPVLVIGALGLLFVVLIVASVFSNDMGGNGKLKGDGKDLPEDVLRFEDDIKDAVDDHNLDEKYVPVLLAILNQESGGDMAATNGDIFQASESKCGEIGCIIDAQESIDQAVKYFKETVEASKGNEEVAIASYNFGDGFASWTQKEHDNEWSKEIAIEYSQRMMDKVDDPGNYSCISKEAEENDACYGDISYVSRIMEYVPDEGGGDHKGDSDFSGDLDKPLDGNIIVTSNFGKRSLNGEIEGHKGIDLNCTGGATPILSAGAGEVVYSDFNDGGYGNSVIIKHEKGFYTQYGHMSSLNVDKGDDVSSGDKVGVCGATGQAYGAHLHFETKEKEWEDQMNPRDFLDFPKEQGD